MPIYEYACTECGHEMEALQKISDAPLLACPECGKDTLKKQISKVAFRLKGTGWYETDFKNQKTGDGKDSTKTGAKSDGKSGNKESKSDGSQSSSSSVSSSSSDSSSSGSGTSSSASTEKKSSKSSGDQ